MAGILANIPVVNNFDQNGRIMGGALLRIYRAGSSTPVTAYKDSGLTAGQEHPWPVVADTAGRIPMFWVADGLYRVRLSSSDGGYVAYDIVSLASVSDSTAASGGNSGVSSEVIHQTGDVIWSPLSGTRSGWIRPNGRTIGSASSGATERANADTQPLYELLYSTFSDSVCPVTGGRGASASADFAANKPLQLLDMRSRVLLAVDGMGNSTAGRNTDTSFSAVTSTGITGGASRFTLSASQLPANIPNSATTSITTQNLGYTGASSQVGLQGGSDGVIFNAPGGSLTIPTITASTSVTINSSGGNPVNGMPPSILGTYYQKL